MYSKEEVYKLLPSYKYGCFCYYLCTVYYTLRRSLYLVQRIVESDTHSEMAYHKYLDLYLVYILLEKYK
jgi:hypothetical protein